MSRQNPESTRMIDVSPNIYLHDGGDGDDPLALFFDPFRTQN
jgi:hypothetical protein